MMIELIYKWYINTDRIMKSKVTKRQLERYPKYLIYLKQLNSEGIEKVSSRLIAEVFDCSEEQVRKDLQAISEEKGTPRSGREVKKMIDTIEDFLDYKTEKDAIIVGVGRLGSALLYYGGFKNYGLNIVAGFDKNEEIVGTEINGKKIYHIKELKKVIKELNVKIAILTSGKDSAQEVADELVSAGIKAIWNFARRRLDVDENVVVENVDLPASLSFLSYKMSQKENKKT